MITALLLHMCLLKQDSSESNVLILHITVLKQDPSESYI